MSDAQTRIGRPSGHDPATLAKAREFAKLTEYGIRAETIIEKEGIPRSSLYRLLGLVREDAAVADQAPAEVTASAPRRRMPLGAVLARAWRYGHERLMQLGAAVNSLWTRIVVAIHEDGDGVRLHIGEHGYRFQERAEVAKLLPGQRPDEFDDWMGMLFRHGYLIEFGEDIALPLGHGLTPGEGARGRRRIIGDPVFPGAEAWGGGGQRPAMQVVQGGLAVDGQSDRGGDGAGLYRDKSSQKSPDTGLFQDENSRNSPDLVVLSRETPGLTGAVDVDVNVKENQNVNININPDRRAGAESRKSRGFANTERDESVPIKSDEFVPIKSEDMAPERSPLADVAADFAGLVKPGRLPNGDEIAVVGGWVQLGASLKMSGDHAQEVIRAVIINRVRAFGDDRPSTLKYFDQEVGKALRAAAARPAAIPAAPPPPAAPALSAEEQQLMRRIRAIGHDFSPNLADFRPDSRNLALAKRWLDAGEAWVRSGRRPVLKPPDFVNANIARAIFEADLLAIEDLLTQPDVSG